MNIEQFNKLNIIYQTLGAISTKGEDTINMAQCLVTLRQMLIEEDKKLNGQEE